MFLAPALPNPPTQSSPRQDKTSFEKRLKSKLKGSTSEKSEQNTHEYIESLIEKSSESLKLCTVF